VTDSKAGAFALQGASAADFEALLALRLRAMHESLAQIGRYDEQRARERLAAGFDPEHTRHMVVDGQRVGFIVLKHLSHALRLDHFYIDPPAQRRGIGSAVMRWVCEQADAELLPVELCALKGSDANRFYLRHGFAVTGDGAWDHDYLRMPTSPSLRAVRAMWAAFEARDWPAARALLLEEMEATWWTSGERIAGAEAFIAVNAGYPDGWRIHLLELAHLQDGRVMSLVRVDHPPRSFFATSFYRVDDGRIAGIDEYWATVEPPPAWRTPKAFAGLSAFDPHSDARARQP
jgi:GNAT superfamily N-acetyltransferase